MTYGTVADAFDEYLQIAERFWRENNDLNVLYGSPLFDDVLADTAPEAPFVLNGRTYKKGYYLADVNDNIAGTPSFATHERPRMVPESSKFFKVYVLQLAGFLLPCYVVSCSWLMILRHRRRQ
ncbi:phospholipid-transporting ATPase 1, partial [Tanacetum coccineum]